MALPVSRTWLCFVDVCLHKTGAGGGGVGFPMALPNGQRDTPVCGLLVGP